MNCTEKNFSGSAFIVAILSSLISIFVIIMWGGVADLLASATNMDFYPDSFFASFVIVVLAASIIYLYIFSRMWRHKIIIIDIDELGDRLFLVFIGLITLSAGKTIPAMICWVIDGKMAILPFEREIGRSPVEFFLIISAINVIAVSVLVLMGRHYTLRSEAGITGTQY